MQDIDKFFHRDSIPSYISDHAVGSAKRLVSSFYFGDLEFDENPGMFKEEYLGNIIFCGSDDEQERKKRQVVTRLKGLEACLKNSSNYPWDKVKELTEKNHEHAQSWLVAAIYNSFEWGGICSSVYVTKGAFLEWKRNLESHLEAAKKLIYDLPPNAYGWMSTYEKSVIEWINRQNSSSPLIDKDRIQHGGPPMQYEFLKLMTDTLESLENNSGFYRKQVNSQYSERDHFIRSLTCALLQQFGRPCRKVVANLASAAFDIDLSEREVIRIAKGIDPEDHYQVVHWWDKDYLNI